MSPVKRATAERQLMAYVLRGLVTSGVAPKEAGRGAWEELPEVEQSRWELMASQVLFSVDRFRSMTVDALTPDAALVESAFIWRGSVMDLATDIAFALSIDQLAELSGEVALAWRTKYQASRREQEARAEALLHVEARDVLTVGRGDNGHG